MNIAVFKEAQEAYARGDYKTALVGFTACTRDVSELSSAEVGKFYHLIGNCFIKSGEPGKAAEYYSKALSLVEPEREPSLLVNLGTAYLSSEDYKEALKAFAKALEHADYATPYKALSGIGAVQLKLGAIEEAGAAYREAALDPANPSPGKALVNLGVCFMELDRSADAVATYETALDLGLPAASANKCRANLGQAYLAQGRVGEAVEAFEAAVADGTFTLSQVAAHDMAMARSLRDRFGAFLGATEPAVAPKSQAAPEPEPVEFIPFNVPQPEDVEPEEELEQETQPQIELEAIEEEPAEEEPASASEDSEEEPAEEGEFDESNAVTQAFPVVTAAMVDGEEPAESEDESGDDDDDEEEPAIDPFAPSTEEEDEDDSTLIPSPEDTAFFTIREEDIENAAKEERRKSRKGHTGLKVALGIVIVLILIAAAAAFAYVRGYGYPLQEAVAQQFLDAAIAEQSTDEFWNEAVTQDSREAQVTVLKDVASYEVTAVERSISSSTVYVTATLNEGGKAYYEILMGRNLITWDVEYIELYFPSEQ